MAMAMLSRQPPLNVSQNPDLGRRGIFYEKILRLEDDVFAGRHAQLKLLSTHVRPDEKPSFNEQNSSLQSTPIPSFKPEVHGNPPQHSKPPPAPTIDPVLLEKSDEPIKAENRFKRERIDRENREIRSKRERIDHELREEWGRPKDRHVLGWEPDVLDVFTKAQLLVPPVSGFEPLRNPASESFDENSYYSSKANSWSSSSKEKGDAADSDAMAISSEGEISEDEFEPQVAQAHHVDVPEPFTEPEILEIEDSDYSPPAPEKSAPQPYAPVAPNQTVLDAVSHLFHSHAQAVSVNHIESPLAPQPSHISPLAMGKLPQQYEQHQPGMDGHSRGAYEHQGNSATTRQKNREARKAARKAAKMSKRSSPNGQNQLHNPKKRRRQDVEEQGGRRKRADRTLESPVFIKEEPVTPPPMSNARPRSVMQRPPSAYYHEPPYSNVQQADLRIPRVEVPAGFKLVPISDPNDYAEPSYPAYRTPAPLQRPQPVIVDQNGNEYFAEPPVLHAIPTRRVRPSVPEGYYDPYPPEQPARATTYYEDYHADGPRRLNERPGTAAPEPRLYTEEEYARLMAPPVAIPRRLIDRPGTVAPEPRQYAERAYSMRPPGPSADAYAQIERPTYREAYGRPEQPIYREAAPLVQYGVARAYSVHPQASAEFYRHSSVAPRAMGPPGPMGPRAASVYPTRYASGPVPQQASRYADAETAAEQYGEVRRVSNRY